MERLPNRPLEQAAGEVGSHGKILAVAAQQLSVSRKRVTTLKILVAFSAVVFSGCFAPEDNRIVEYWSHSEFVVMNRTGEVILVKVGPRPDSMTTIAFGESMKVAEREWGFTCDPVPTSQLGCLRVYSARDTQLVYQRTSDSPAPWDLNAESECRYRFTLVLEAGDISALPETEPCE